MAWNFYTHTHTHTHTHTQLKPGSDWEQTSAETIISWPAHHWTAAAAGGGEEGVVGPARHWSGNGGGSMGSMGSMGRSMGRSMGHSMGRAGHINNLDILPFKEKKENHRVHRPTGHFPHSTVCMYKTTTQLLLCCLLLLTTTPHFCLSVGIQIGHPPVTGPTLFWIYKTLTFNSIINLWICAWCNDINWPH